MSGPGPEGAAGPGRRLGELDLVVFDKDGTLIDFDAMWAGWVVGLAARLEAALGHPIRDELYVALGFDPASGHADRKSTRLNSSH